jgi:hypothetical protein
MKPAAEKKLLAARRVEKQSPIFRVDFQAHTFHFTGKINIKFPISAASRGRAVVAVFVYFYGAAL